jgi:uncharacterized membrane protein
MEPNNNISTSEDGKTAGIISYFFIIGWLIAFFAIHQNHKTELGSYQLRQTLLFHIVSAIAFYVLNMIFYSLLFTEGFWAASALNWLMRSVIIVFWVIGFLGALNGEKKPIPLIGEKAQSIFSSI